MRQVYKGQKRRGNHEGSYSYDERRNLFRYRESYTAADGKQKVKELRARNKGELRRKIKKWHEERDAGLDIQENLTVKAWIEKWLALKKPTIRQRTFSDYKRIMETKIIPVIGHIRIAKLTVADCQEMINSYAATLSPETVNDIRRRLKVMVRAAVDQGLLARDVAGLTKSIHQRKKPIIALSEEEVRRLLDAADHWDDCIHRDTPETVTQTYNRHAVRVMVHLALNSGCRLGELLGMSWKQVNFRQKTIHITQSLSQTSGRCMIEDVKTRSSFRKIQLTDEMTDRLREWKKEQAAYANLLGELYDSSPGLVFANGWGKPMNSSNFYQRYWNPLLKLAEMPENITFHALRKTHATLLLRAGVNIKVVSERLGHSSTSVTANVYSALLPDMQGEAVQALDKILKKGDMENEKKQENTVVVLQHDNGKTAKSWQS